MVRKTVIAALLGFTVLAVGARLVDGPPAAADTGVYDRRWAVVIGVNQFRDARISRLNYAVSDARAVASALDGLGFPKERVVLLLDKQATRAAIEQALSGALRRNTGPGDGVFVFIATHGVTMPLPHGGEEGYLLPHDADVEDLPLTALSMQHLRQIGGRLPARHVLFAVDGCYSGYSLVRSVAPATVTQKYLELVSRSRAIQILTAGRRDQPVIEDRGHGVFTLALLDGLRGHADLNGDGLITASELGAWMHPRVARASDFLQDMQWGNLDGEGQFIFRLPATVAATPPATPPPPLPPPPRQPPATDPAVVSAPPRPELGGAFGVWIGTVSSGQTDGMVNLALARAGNTLEATLTVSSVYFRGRVETYGLQVIELNRRMGETPLAVVALSQDGRHFTARDASQQLTVEAALSKDGKRLSGVVTIGFERYDLRLQRK